MSHRSKFWILPKVLLPSYTQGAVCQGVTSVNSIISSKRDTSRQNLQRSDGNTILPNNRHLGRVKRGSQLCLGLTC